jgi:hypothetical protein
MNKLCSKASTNYKKHVKMEENLEKVRSLEEFSLVIVMHLKIEMT